MKALFIIFVMGLVGFDLPMKEVRSEPLPVFYSGHYNKSEQMKINYVNGDNVGDHGLIFVKNVQPDITKQGWKLNKAKFLCKCGITFDSRMTNVRSNNTKSCGCSRRNKIRLIDSKVYQMWTSIKRRCNNINTKDYKNYGGRGIIMCEEWSNSFKLFSKYISKLEGFGTVGYSLDRKNNDGNYESGNIRFSTRSVQSINRRLMKNNKSGYTGVFYRKDINKYRVNLYLEKKRISIGNFTDLESAVIARNKYILNNNLPHKTQTYGRR